MLKWLFLTLVRDCSLATFSGCPLCGSRAVKEVILTKSDLSMHDAEHDNHITSSVMVLKGGQAERS